MKKFFLIGAFLLLTLKLVLSASALINTKPQLPCANSITCAHNLTAQIENGSSGTFEGQPVVVPEINPQQDFEFTTVLGEQSPAPNKHIYVDLSTQKLYAFENDQLFLETYVSTGKYDRTPPGEYRIWVKLRSTRMSGGTGYDAYDLPNVPYVLFFYSPDVPKTLGYSLHGVYWHNNFGHPMSHGCVNMRTIDAHKIYDWASPTTQKPTTYESADDPGTPISICRKIDFSQGNAPVCQE